MKNAKKKKQIDLQECHGDLCGHINICYKRSPNDVFVCTRAIGHKGDHVACSGGDLHNLAVWKNASNRKNDSEPKNDFEDSDISEESVEGLNEDS